MATYPSNPNLTQVDSATLANPTNWNQLLDNINAIGLDLVTAYADGQLFPGVDHTASQATNIDGKLQAICHMLSDITGETNWYDSVDISLDSIMTGVGTFTDDDTTPDVSTGGPFAAYACATGHAAQVTLTDLDGATDKQVVFVIGGNNSNKSVFEENSRLDLQGDWTEADGSTLMLLYSTSASAWSEVSRNTSQGLGDASTLDGIDSASFLRSDTDDTFTSGTLTLAAGAHLQIDGEMAYGESTFTNDDTTPSVDGYNVWNCATGHAAAKTVSTIDGGTQGQKVLIVGGNPTHLTTFTTGGNLDLRADWVEADTATLYLHFDGSTWQEISRSPETAATSGISVITFSDADTTPTVSGADVCKTSAAGATITDFDNGVDGQPITVQWQNSDTEVVSNGNIKLQGGLNFIGAQYDTLTLSYDTSVWEEIGRGFNS